MSENAQKSNQPQMSRISASVGEKKVAIQPPIVFVLLCLLDGSVKVAHIYSPDFWDIDAIVYIMCHTIKI